MGLANDGASLAPIDRPVLERLQSRFATSPMFESATVLEAENLHLRVDISGEYYPNDVSARLEIRWYRNDDFSVHYHEDQQGNTWRCRWDRHPNTHNSRDHFHPPPAAGRADAEDSQWPDDHRDVVRLALDRVEERIETLWARR